MSNLFTLLFAPTFLILMRYFDFKSIALLYIIFSIVFLLFAFIKKKKLEDYVIISIYLILLSLAYVYDSFEAVKFIPFFSAMTFFTIFAYASLKNHNIIYRFTKKFYKKELSSSEVIFLKAGDSFWAVAILIYAIFLLYLVFYASDNIWAFFSSIGWYIYFTIALTTQILYGKLYAIKMLTK